MKWLIILLIVSSSFAVSNSEYSYDEDYQNNDKIDVSGTGNTVTKTVTTNNNYVLPTQTDTIVVVKEVMDTVVLNTRGKVVDAPRTFIPTGNYNIKTVSVQFVMPIDNMLIDNDGIGLKVNVLFKPDITNNIYVGARLGYSQFNNIQYRDKDYIQTGQPEIDSVYNATYPPKPYRSLEMSALVGGKRLQAIIGYGYFVDESMFVFGINLDTYSKVGVSLGISNLVSSNRYAPEICMGVSISL